jgi:Subtilisin inhibitor-like
VIRTGGMRLRCAACLRYVLIVTACAAAVTACGSAASSSGGSPSSGSHSPAATPKVSLTITVTGSPGSPARHWTLTCDPAGGTHPDPAAACADLLRAKGPAYAQPKGLMCPMILASAKMATIQGTYFGQPVNSTIRDGGCTITKWAQLGQVIG